MVLQLDGAGHLAGNRQIFGCAKITGDDDG